MPKRKQKIKWASIITGLGAITTSVVVPITMAIKSEESEITQLKNDTNNLINKLSFDIHKWIDRLYEDISEVDSQDELLKIRVDALTLEIAKLKSALRTLHSNDGDEKAKLTDLEKQLLAVQLAVSNIFG